MNPGISSPIPFRISLILIFFVAAIKIHPVSTFDWYSSCSNNFNCGEITDVGFPFWGDGRPEGCGHPSLKMNCKKNLTTINIMDVNYQILKFTAGSKTLTIARSDYSGNLCPKKFVNTTLDYQLFDSIPGYHNITLLYCSFSTGRVPGQFRCPDFEFGFVEDGARGPGFCNASVVVPVSLPGVSAILNAANVSDAIKAGFEVKWKEDSEGCGACEKSKGVCGYDLSSNQTTCYCSGYSAGLRICPAIPTAGAPAILLGGNESKKSHLIIGLSIGGAAILGICLGCWVFKIKRRKKKHLMKLKSKDFSSQPSSEGIPTPSPFLSQSISSYPYSSSDMEKGSSYFGAQVFSYTELQEATSNFDRSRELGDGGYGIVYSGTLRDGRIVAVKRLYENNCKRIEQFMNEVEILSLLQHSNLVKLYGCTSKHSQELLLVYEYIPNGTLADHLHGNRANSGLLSWFVRLRIAIQTASALAYLHCKDIIHRDVKTNNILLSNNLQVKVADFGLSRLFPNDVSHVSTAPQGTPGYVDPDYYQCYRLTDKSDVYSFGVVLVELVSSLQALDTNRNRKDINLSSMAIDRIQNQALQELVDPNLGFERNYAVRCMIISVVELAFRCLQQAPNLRPSMDEVLEVLRGIENEESSAQKSEVVGVGSDGERLLRNMLSPPSSVSDHTDKWVRNSKKPHSRS